MQMILPRILLFPLCCLIVPPSLSYAGPTLSVKDTNGKTLSIELLSFHNDKVTFVRTGDPQEFTLPLSRFHEDSRLVLQEEGKKLAPPPPKFEVDLVIGKRRYKDDSDFMVRQEITSKVTVKNKDLALALPKVKGRILYFGQDRRRTKEYSVLAIREFSTEVGPGQSATPDIPSFQTRYDSDNKGYGNIGGFQYVGYVLIIMNESGDVLFTKTTDALVRKAIGDSEDLVGKMLSYKEKTKLDEKLRAWAVGSSE